MGGRVSGRLAHPSSIENGTLNFSRQFSLIDGTSKSCSVVSPWSELRSSSEGEKASSQTHVCRVRRQQRMAAINQKRSRLIVLAPENEIS